MLIDRVSPSPRVGLATRVTETLEGANAPNELCERKATTSIKPVPIVADTIFTIISDMNYIFTDDVKVASIETT